MYVENIAWRPLLAYKKKLLFWARIGWKLVHQPEWMIKTSIRSRHGPVLLRYIRTACINKRYCILPLNVLFLRVRAKKINDPDSLLQ